MLPYQCLLCGKEAEENAIFCSNCFSKISFIEQPICSICGRMFEFTVNDIEETCNQCSDGTRFFDMARSLLHYDELSRQLIMKIKRHSDHITACTCVKMLHTRYSDILERCDLVVPVPSHWTRLLRRSYNPANIIAIELTKISGKKYKNVLKRSKKTEYQRAKSIIERINNVLDAFSCKFDLNGKSVVLVDDVMTTGATLNECAKVLKHAGAKKVICITIACTRALCFNFG
ncbi:MAG: ComF family protein [Holosporales bacterium]|nr:ComF family protein [Holosporales bacterium]